MSLNEQNVESGCCTGWVFLGQHYPTGSSQIEPENSDTREIDQLKVKTAEQEKHIELLNKRAAKLNEREKDLTERLDRLQTFTSGKNAGEEKVLEEMGAEIIQLRKRLNRRTSKLLRVEKEAKERNDRKEMSIRRLETTVAELRRLNEDANREDSRKGWRIKKLEEKMAELNQQVKGTTTVAELRRQLQERTTELSILEAENQRNANKAKKVDDLEAKMGVLNRALEDKKARLSDLEEAQSRRSGWRAKSPEQSDTTAVELNRRLQEEMVKISKMEEAARRKDEEVKVLKAKVVELSVPGETEASRRKGKGKGIEQSDDTMNKLNQRLEEEMAKAFMIEEAARRKEKEIEEKMAELKQRLRRDTDASRQKDRAMALLERQKTEAERLLHEKTVKLSNLEDVIRRNSRKEKDIEWLEARVGELEQRLQDKTSNMEEIVRQNSRKERESKRLETKMAGLEMQLQEKTVKLSNMEARKEGESKRLETKIAGLEMQLQEKTVKLSNMEAVVRQNSRKGDSKRLETKIARLEQQLQEKTVELSDARLREQINSDLSTTNQKQRDEINQLKALVKTAGEQATSPPSQALALGRKADSISAVEVGDLVRMLNAQIEQVSTLIADTFSYQKSSRSREGPVALNDLRDYLGPWLFNNLSRRLNEPKTESDPLIIQIALQTVLVHACSRIINHWNPPFWNDGSIFFRIYSNMGGVGQIIAGTWSAMAHTMSQSRIREANVKYLSETLVKVIVAVGGSLPSGRSLPPQYKEKVEDIAKRALELHHIVGNDVTSMDLVTYTIPSDTQFDPSQMDDTESADKTGSVPQDKVVCTLEMGLQYRKRVELGKQGGEQCGVTLKPKVVLSATVEA